MTTLAPNPPLPAAPTGKQPRRPQPSRGAFGLAVDVLSSQKLTVVVLLLLAAVTYFGTLAQEANGIYYVQQEYFESWLVWDTVFGVQVPVLPGAVPLLALLFANLVVGGCLRLRWQLRNVGVLITHLGVALLLVAGWVKLEMSYAGHLSLYEGNTGNAVRSFQEWELALLQKDGDAVLERTMPATAFEHATGELRVPLAGDGLPFAVEVHHFAEHCVPVQKTANVKETAPLVGGVFLATDPRFVQPAKDREQKLAGCYVTVRARGSDETAEAILWAGDLLTIAGRDPTGAERSPIRPFTFTMAGATWGLELRHVLWTLPFDVRLDRFKKSDHPGSRMVRDYSSFVTVLEQGGGSRPAHIYMNEPLRKDGYVFFQTSWGPPNSATGPYYSTFEVASNPSDKWPEYACYVIAAGMLVHFVWKLLRFLGSENRKRTQEALA